MHLSICRSRDLPVDLAISCRGELFSGIEATGTTAYSVAPDGRFLLVRSGTAAPEADQSLTFVLNWFEELQRRVPARPIAWRR